MTATVSGNVVDSKGRAAVSTMSDREVAEETLLLLRVFSDAISELSNSPMAKAMLPGFPKLP
jgi:hypothetical protein